MVRKLSLLAGLLLLTMVAGEAFQQQQAPERPAAPQGQGQGQGRRGGQGPARDRAAEAAPQGTGVIAGRVLSADNGRPIKRARVSVTAPDVRVARSTVTDDQGRFQIGELVAGSYTIAASKAGFVDALYGQRRPLQPGTPLQLSDGQQVGNVDVRLMRGGVITGRILDEDGEPLARAMVSVVRYQYVRGERQLMPAGMDQTDDRGQYRVFGLPPGEYFISANAAGLAGALRGVATAVIGGGGGRGGGGGLGPLGGGLGAAVFGGGVEEDPGPTGYAPTYYPGVVTVSDAAKITLAGGQEAAGLDFQLQLVRTITVSGVVVGNDGNSVGVALMPDDGVAGGIIRGQTFRTNSREDGTFSIANVTPGHYTAVARTGGRWNDPRIATQTLVVGSENISGLTLTLIGGITVSGNITVETSGAPAPTDYSRFRVNLTSLDPTAGPTGPFARGGGPGTGTGTGAEKNGVFVAENVLPGKYVIGAQGPSPWTLKSVGVGGRDATDQVVELRGGQDVTTVTVVFSDRTTQLDGTVRDGAGTPVPAMTVIAFSADPIYWRAQSRHIQVARTDQSGAYHLRALPAGDYLVVAVDDAEQGEWFDPSYLQQVKDAATAISLSDADTKTLDLKPRS